MEVYERIMSILRRIFILTILYEFVLIFVLLILPIYDSSEYHVFFGMMYKIALIVLSVTANYSIFLMQQHNDEEYIKFLLILYTMKVHIFCRCCKKGILEAMESKEIEANLQAIERQKSDNDKKTENVHGQNGTENDGDNDENINKSILYGTDNASNGQTVKRKIHYGDDLDLPQWHKPMEQLSSPTQTQTEGNNVDVLVLPKKDDDVMVMASNYSYSVTAVSQMSSLPNTFIADKDTISALDAIDEYDEEEIIEYGDDEEEVMSLEMVNSIKL